MEAYDAAQAVMKAVVQGQTQPPADAATLDVRV